MDHFHPWAGGSSSIWFNQVRFFKAYFNVLLIDLRGHGSLRLLQKEQNIPLKLL